MGFDDDDFCHTGLALGLGLSSPPPPPSLLGHKSPKQHHQSSDVGKPSQPSLTLALSAESFDLSRPFKKAHQIIAGAQSDQLYGAGQDHSAASSFSNNVSVKREREIERERDTGSDEDDDGSNARKKLRLTKAQSALLEDCFKNHSTLNPKQKQDLARELKLRPRQVEVWFQNRRARTKLKQTELDCEYLKKCCETLTDENRRLQRELQELRALKLAKPLYMQLPAPTLSMCPSCERLGAANDGAAKSSAFTMAPKPHFYNPFAKPSAAC
ncbi:homeobox-leucine zipper protein HAT22-like [Andrographis paniculata]|uniref:homeobox-leucine zipper protein HAT22-like n=1 Tax=Andrographis paniculata TaxID=175694 RepID=UPI0021E75ED1|nr:homeobox-leucine zipper protein HAT22-like [Andrographis paniculata]